MPGGSPSRLSEGTAGFQSSGGRGHVLTGHVLLARGAGQPVLDQRLETEQVFVHARLRVGAEQSRRPAPIPSSRFHSMLVRLRTNSPKPAVPSSAAGRVRRARQLAIRPQPTVPASNRVAGDQLVSRKFNRSPGRRPPPCSPGTLPARACTSRRFSTSLTPRTERTRASRQSTSRARTGPAKVT